MVEVSSKRSRLVVVGLVVAVLGAILPPATSADGQIASVGCSQWRHAIGDGNEIYTGYEDSHDDFTDTTDQSGGDVLRWLGTNGSYWQSVYATTTGDEVAVVWMLCIRFGDTITDEHLETVFGHIRDRWPTQPVYVVSLDVERPDPCQLGDFEQSEERRTWVLANLAGTLLGPELRPTLSASEVTSGGCHPNQAGIDRYAELLTTWVPIMLAGGSGGGTGTFGDDDGSVHEGYIEAIAAAGITVGCNTQGTLFCPDDGVPRDQIASFLARALDLPPPVADAFDDDAGNTHEDNINRVAEAGITLGCGDPGDRTFCPSDIMTRGQMASMLARAFGLASSPTDFFDDDAGSVHEDNINRVAQDGITLGCDIQDTTRFCPSDTVTRAQMASFLGRALELEPIDV